MPAQGSDCPTLCSAELILFLHEGWKFIELLQHQRDVFLEPNRLCILERVLQLHQIIFLPPVQICRLLAKRSPGSIPDMIIAIFIETTLPRHDGRPFRLHSVSTASSVRQTMRDGGNWRIITSGA
jgi:hypothetical protein